MWQVPRCFEGGTVAVLASGPSMSQAVADEVQAAGVPAIVVNSTFRLAPWAWLLYGADASWWMHASNADAHRFAGLKATVEECGIPMLRHTGTQGFDPDPGAVRTGNNSGYQALHIAAHTGARRILLCGFDMHGQAGSHWHGDHPWGLRCTTDHLFAKWVAHFATIAKPLRDMGVEVLNCTPGSAIQCFPVATLGDALARAEA